MLCSICHKYNHNMVDCYHNTAHEKSTLKEGGEESDDGMYKEDGEVGMA